MLTMEEWMDIRQLNREGHSVRAIARMTGFSRNTVRSVLRNGAPKPYTRKPQASKLDPFKDYLSKRYTECELSAVRLREEIAGMGYTGCINLVQRYLRTLSPATRALTSATVRFETPPGAQAQVDWAYCGRFAGPDGKEIPVYAFVMVLSFSRMLFVEFTTSMSLLTLLACHMQAFGYFGGVTKSILYDNMKQVSIRPGTWNALFLDFAGYYGFSPRTCRIRRPRTKGKVERMVAYIKDNFLAGRSFAGLTDLNTQARHWLEHTANVRVHATTGKRPADLLAEEKLCPVNTRRPYALPEVVSRKVDRESFVSHSGSRYMVAPEHVGKQVQVYCYGDKLVIRSAETILAQHKRATSTGQTVADKEHVSRLWELCAMGEQSKQPPSWQLNTGEQVATRALAEYEEVVA